VGYSPTLKKIFRGKNGVTTGTFAVMLWACFEGHHVVLQECLLSAEGKAIVSHRKSETERSKLSSRMQTFLFPSKIFCPSQNFFTIFPTHKSACKIPLHTPPIGK
jgi:hypothetical protein